MLYQNCHLHHYLLSSHFTFFSSWPILLAAPSLVSPVLCSFIPGHGKVVPRGSSVDCNIDRNLNKGDRYRSISLIYSRFDVTVQ